MVDPSACFCARIKTLPNFTWVMLDVLTKIALNKLAEMLPNAPQ